MFMFRRSRTTNLTRKLLRKRIEALNDPSLTDRGPLGPWDTREKDVRNLLKQLQETQLTMLLTALDTRGLELGHCVLVPRTSSFEPHLLLCQFWRWPEVRCASDLRRLPQCGAAEDLVYSCCNPFHWSRICQPETPPPPYSRNSEDRIRPEDRAPSELPLLTRDSFESLTTSGESAMNRPEWCTLAYWEHQHRVGPLFPVEPNYVNIFGSVPYGLDGLSLEALGLQSARQCEASQKTRNKIKLGITLTRDVDGFVWLYNRSDQPVFADSLYLKGGCDDRYGWPTRIPPDHCLCVHAPGNPQTFGWDKLMPEGFPKGPAPDSNSVRISFVKGWGGRYSRREIISCPCWLEILLAPCR